jgi:hypothetical protein
VARLGFDPRDTPPGLVEELGGEGSFWKAFEAELPASLGSFPFQLVVPKALPRDPGGFSPVLYYFGAYIFVVGPLLAILFRKKPRRRWLPFYLLGAPLLFSVGIPFLHASFELQPSLGSVMRAAYFGPGAKRGVARAVVVVRSSGRQQHRLEARGRGIIHHAAQPDGHSAEVIRHDEDPARIVFSTPPWGEANLVIVADASLERAIQGTAVLQQSTGLIRIRAKGLPPPRAGSQLKVLLPAGPLGTSTITIPGDVLEGAIDEQVMVSAANAPLRAILVLDVDDAPLAVESGDMAFGSRSRALIFQELNLEIR